MIRSQLVKRLLNKNPHLIQKDVEKVTSLVLDKIISTLESDGRVEIRGLVLCQFEKGIQKMEETQGQVRAFLFLKKKLRFLNLEKD